MNNKITNASEIIQDLDFGTLVPPDELMQSDIMNAIIVEIYNGWPGPTGRQRVVDKVRFLCERVPQYAKVMGKTELETLEALAKSRNCNYTNYFQDANIPDLSDVYVFDTLEDVRVRFPSKQYVCPRCEGITTDPQECNSGVIVDKKKKEVCNWKSYGLFGTLGKGINVLVKSKSQGFPRPINIFKPIELVDAVIQEGSQS